MKENRKIKNEILKVVISLYQKIKVIISLYRYIEK